MGAGCSSASEVHSPRGNEPSVRPSVDVKSTANNKFSAPAKGDVEGPPSGSSGLTTVDEGVSSASLIRPTEAQAAEHHGAPAPSDEQERMETLKSLKVLDTEPEQRFDDITKLCCMIFKVPICLVSLVDSERQWFKSVQGLPNNETPRTSSFCAWTLLPASPEVLVVENALMDVRFRNNPLVIGFPNIRFYAGAPLIASDGKRLGSLCIIDNKPRQFDADSGTMLANFGEMAVRELERDKVLELQKRASAALSQEKTQLLRAINCFSEAIMLCNVSEPSWPLMFVNDSWEKATGISRDMAVTTNFWEVFKVKGNDDKVARTQEAYQEAISTQQMFKLVVELQMPGTGSTTTLTLQFRSANSGTLDGPLVGIPSTVQTTMSTAHSEGRNYYYVSIVPPGSADATAAPAGSRPSSAAIQATHSVKLFTLITEKVDPFEDAKLGPLLGCGAFGRVYRGQWNNASVAIKVLEHHEGADQMEALLSVQISHPNVVRTFKHCCRAMPRGDEHSQRLCETWLIMEFCNKGTLTDAVDRGWFRERGSLFDVDYRIMLDTAKEIASAMAYLHGLNILHGDLTGQNVLLSAGDGSSGRPFTAKVADFGFSRVCDTTTTKTRTHGSISHTPPELLLEGVLSKAADVHAFGMLLWEMFMGQRPFMGMSQAQIIHHISSKRKLTVSDACPPVLRKLLNSCCHPDYQQRPTFVQLLGELDELVDELC